MDLVVRDALRVKTKPSVWLEKLDIGLEEETNRPEAPLRHMMSSMRELSAKTPDLFEGSYFVGCFQVDPSQTTLFLSFVAIDEMQDGQARQTDKCLHVTRSCHSP